MFSELLLVFITVLNLPAEYKLGFLGNAVKATLEIGQTPNSMFNIIPKEQCSLFPEVECKHDVPSVGRVGTLILCTECCAPFSINYAKYSWDILFN